VPAVPRYLVPALRAAIFFTLATIALADDSAWLTRPWLSDDGLPNNTVNAIAQTPDGYLWIATANGLARFDGVQFDEFPSAKLIRPPDRGILAMAATRSGGLWLATDRSTVLYVDPNHKKIFTGKDGLLSFSVNAIVPDSEGGVWILYRGGLVCRLKNGRATQFTEKEGLPDGVTICSMACDKTGQTWFTKGGQLGIFRDGKFQTRAQLDAAPSRLAAARDGGIWVCCGSHLFKYTEDGKIEDHGSFTPRRGQTEVSAMLESRDGAVWIGTTVNGLFRYADSRFEAIHTEHQEILGLAEDAKENIWVGTGGGGLNQIRPRAVQLQTSADGLPYETVQALAQDTSGVIWAVTAEGSLARRADGRWSTVLSATNWVTCVASDPGGGLWIGMRYHGLFRYRNNHFEDWRDKDQSRGQTIRTLVVSRSGDLWIGGDTPPSVTRLHNGKMTNYELPRDIRVIRASTEDADGNIWFGTSKGILMRVEGDHIVDETARTTGEPEPIRCLYATPDGALWIGYAGAGIGVLESNRFAIISAKQGLYDDFVSQIVADDKGWLWFGANRGLFKVRRKDLESAISGSDTRVRSVHYGQGDGLPSLQANFGASPMCLRSADGHVWLAMRTALAVVEPERLRENLVPPPVLLTRVDIGDKILAAYGGVMPVAQEDGRNVVDLAKYRGELRLPPNNRLVAFHFTTLNFVAPENVSLRYRLVGMDEDWTEAGSQRIAGPYPRLPDGDYQFEVSACNSQGIWSDSAATLRFVVAPFFWQTWWFRTTAVLAFTALIIAIVRYVSFRRLHRRLLHLEQQAALHKERARIAKDIHDDLGASLTQISFIGELARQDSCAPEKLGSHIDRISGAARQAVKSLDEIVWAVNPRNDTLAHFIDYTGQFALDYLQLAGIRCRLDLPEQTPERELSTDVRHNLFLVVKEAINNTVKYAGATEVRLRIAIENGKLEVTIEDNGSGFEQLPADAGADGLRNMRQRIADIGGECRIEGRPGCGVKISVELPLERNEKPAAERSFNGRSESNGTN
jgi:ligand-binding sensor domain-containing protein/signal transduction histidine kinase